MKYQIDRNGVTTVSIVTSFQEFGNRFVGIIIFFGAYLLITPIAILQLEQFDNSYFTFYGISVVIILVGGIIFYQMNKGIQLEISDTTLKIGGQKVQISPSTEVMLLRKVYDQDLRQAARQSGTISFTPDGVNINLADYMIDPDLSPAKAYIYSTWTLVLREGKVTTKYLEIKEDKKNFNHLGTAMNDIAETIAEELNLTFVDYTGEEEIVIPPGQTDTALITRLKERSRPSDPLLGGSSYDEELVGTQYTLKFQNRKSFQLLARDLAIGLLVFVFFGLLLVVDILQVIDFFGNGQTVEGVVFLLPIPVILLFLWVGFTILNQLSPTTIIVIGPSYFQLKTKHLITSSDDHKIDLTDLERIIIYRIGVLYGIEISTETLRIPILTNLSIKEAEQLKKNWEYVLYNLST